MQKRLPEEGYSVQSLLHDAFCLERETNEMSFPTNYLYQPDLMLLKMQYSYIEIYF